MQENQKEIEKINSLFAEERFDDAKNILEKHIEKIDAIKSALDDVKEKNTLNDIRRDRIVLLRVINLALIVKKLERGFEERITRVENNFKSVNENVRKLNQRIDEWETGR